MSLIKKQEKTTRQTMTMSVDEIMGKAIKVYGRFINEEVRNALLEAMLKYVLIHDEDFEAYLEKQKQVVLLAWVRKLRTEEAEGAGDEQVKTLEAVS